MHEEEIKDAVVEAMFNRLQTTIVKNASTLPPDSQIRTVALRTLDELRERIANDTEFIRSFIHTRARG